MCSNKYWINCFIIFIFWYIKVHVCMCVCVYFFSLEQKEKKYEGNSQKKRVSYLEPMKPGIQEFRFSRFSLGEVGDCSSLATTAPPPRRGLATRPKFNDIGD